MLKALICSVFVQTRNPQQQMWQSQAVQGGGFLSGKTKSVFNSFAKKCTLQIIRTTIHFVQKQHTERFFVSFSGGFLSGKTKPFFHVAPKSAALQIIRIIPFISSKSSTQNDFFVSFSGGFQEDGTTVQLNRPDRGAVLVTSWLGWRWTTHARQSPAFWRVGARGSFINSINNSTRTCTHMYVILCILKLNSPSARPHDKTVQNPSAIHSNHLNFVIPAKISTYPPPSS